MKPATKPALRILGIDPGLRVTGFGLIDAHDGHRLSYVASGVIRVPDGELATRLGTIYQQLQDVIGQYQPHCAAVEKVFVNINPASTLLLGHARGAALCALAVAGLPVSEYTALQIKQSVVGYGRASKEQVQAMMVRLLALPGTPSKDAADALRMRRLACPLRPHDHIAEHIDRHRWRGRVAGAARRPGSSR